MNASITSVCTNVDAKDYILVKMTPKELLERLFYKYDRNNDNSVSFF